MTDTNKERAEFEAWIRTQPGYTYAVLGRRDSPGSARVGEYVSQSVEFSWRAWQARAAKAPAAPTGWYALAADGMATLCVDRDDAEKTAADSEKKWPNCGPFRAVQLYTAPPAPTEQWINAADMAALQRVNECIEDNEGFDVPVARMKRMAELGVVRRIAADLYSLTAFGRHLIDDGFRHMPLETVDECNARLSAEHFAKFNPAPPQGAAKGAT